MTNAARIPPGTEPALAPPRRGAVGGGRTPARGPAAAGPRAGAESHRPAWRVWLRRTAAAALAGAVLGAPWWVPRALATMEFFRLRQVEIVGARYLEDAEVMARLDVDTTTSVWTDVDALERRLARHPQVASVDVSRRLPGTLAVRLTEYVPVALVPAGAGMQAVDASGRPLPIDPTRAALDLPVVMQRDTSVLRMLGAVRDSDAALFRRISEVRRGAGRDLQLMLTPTRRQDAAADSARGPVALIVRASAGVSAARLGELWAVEADLSRRGVRAAELDLRYRDQVVARLQ